MSIQKDLAAIAESDLLALIEQPVMEDKTTEYKEALNIGTDDAKRKFLAGIASFANASGGDLIYGMKADDGRPLSLQPLVGFNSDATLLTLSELVRSHIDPKVYGIGFQPVPLAAGGNALVIRVPKTWAGAHMLTYGKDNRFYTRGVNGRTLMDVPEIRAAFSLSETTAERIRRFRMERIGNILAGETPVPLDGSALMVVHLCPLVSFQPGFVCNFKTIRGERIAFKPMRSTSWDHSVDFDGDFSFSGVGTRDVFFGYNKLFHNGCMEAVDAATLSIREIKGKPTKSIPSGVFEKYIFESVAESLVVLKRASVEPPALVMLSLLGVHNYFMMVNPEYDNYQARQISRNNLIAPELALESFDLAAQEVASLMRPIFDTVWAACGWPQSINYSDDGSWGRTR